jgi:ubiquitin-conjugating enzyme E2 Q
MATIRLLGEPTYANPAATKILNREIKALTKVMNSTPPHELGWYIDTASLSNMYQWIVEFHSFPMDLPLAQDLRKVGMSSIVLEIRFGVDFPVSPPFVRVVRPRFVPFMYGGGGNVTAGGAICMELLTNDAWSPGYAMESVLFQVRLQVMDRERPGRVAAVADYGTGEAIEAYLRACRAHGWKPQDMSGFR